MKMTSPNDDIREPFKFKDASEKLQDHPKLSVEETSKKDKSETCPGENKSALNETNKKETVQRENEAQPDSVKGERPQGRKAAKADYIKKQYYETKLKVAKEALLLQRKRADEIKRQNKIA
ncbi:hypothetical protein FGB62_379g05 [Gracilaria domingensis]|nr:hypothetical protein FGB62_379g05 [Gracilaria domingensis]